MVSSSNAIYAEKLNENAKGCTNFTEFGQIPQLPAILVFLFKCYGIKKRPAFTDR